MREFSRREFFGITLGLAAGYAGSEIGRRIPFEAGSPLEYAKNLSKESAAQLALRVAQAQERIRPYEPKLDSAQDVQAFAEEYVPYLAADGLVKDFDLNYPPITIEDYRAEGSDKVFHLLGRSQCISSEAPIDINERLFNQYSAWRTTKGIGLRVSTLAHEINHSNQVSCEIFSLDVETATQMTSTNTLASMALDGSRVALPGFLEQMLRFSQDYVLYKCLQEQAEMDTDSNKGMILYEQELGVSTTPRGMDWYDEFLGRLPNGPTEQGYWARNWQKYKTETGALLRSVEKYGAKPYMYTAEAMKDPDKNTRKLSLPTPGGKFTMFSTAYLLENLSDLTDSYIKNGQQLAA